jgi:hypothetical protein
MVAVGVVGLVSASVSGEAAGFPMDDWDGAVEAFGVLGATDVFGTFNMLGALDTVEPPADCAPEPAPACACANAPGGRAWLATAHRLKNAANGMRNLLERLIVAA